MEYVALGIAVFAGGVVSGFAGFAFSAVAGAILLHFLRPTQADPLDDDVLHCIADDVDRDAA